MTSHDLNVATDELFWALYPGVARTPLQAGDPRIPSWLLARQFATQNWERLAAGGDAKFDAYQEFITAHGSGGTHDLERQIIYGRGSYAPVAPVGVDFGALEQKASALGEALERKAKIELFLKAAAVGAAAVGAVGFLVYALRR
jgi:hypothetical protein